MENTKTLERQLLAVYLQQQQLAQQEITLREEIRKEQNKESQNFLEKISTELLNLIQESTQIDFLSNLDQLDAEDNRIIMVTLENYLQLDEIRSQMIKAFFQEATNYTSKDNNDKTFSLQKVLNCISQAVFDKYALEDSNNYVYPVELMYPHATIREIQAATLTSNDAKSINSVNKDNINESIVSIPYPNTESADLAKEVVDIPKERRIKKIIHQTKESIAKIFKR